MGQKVNPHGMRVGVINDWDSKWFAEKDYAALLVEDAKIRQFLKKHNQNCLIHIIQERRERFPESIRSQSDSKIAGQIMNALERGIKMQRRDRSFAKASYSGKSGTISWFMPLHIDAPLSEDPELVMVVRRSGDFYEIKTILSYDDELKDRITALSLYSKLW